MTKPWNTCPRCQTVLDIPDDAFDGTEVYCRSCEISLVCTVFEDETWELMEYDEDEEEEEASDDDNDCQCGFRTGQRVKMRSALVRVGGAPIGVVHGMVTVWHAGCGHLVMWDEIPTATALPNPNVLIDDGLESSPTS
jgi:hypothetical protein